MPSTTFTASGTTTQSFQVPAGVTTITVDAVGAEGGSLAPSSGTPGKGGRVKCDIAVTPGQWLYIKVGTTPALAGAFGYGAHGGASSTGYPAGIGNGGGGGSIIRTGTGPSIPPISSQTILVVAPGGGGAGTGTSPAAGGDGGTPNGSAGGNGAAVSGYPAITGGGGGSATAGGTAGAGQVGSINGTVGTKPLTNEGSGGYSPATSYSNVNSGGGGGGGWWGGGGGGSSIRPNRTGGGGGGSGLSSGVAETIQNGVNTGDGYVTLTWTVPSIANCSTVTFTPGNTVGASHDQPAVYSSSASLDTGFGTNRTPAGWPATGALIKAVEVELTVTSQFTADGEVQVGVFAPDDLDPLPGATSDASAAFSGWTGEVREYVSGFADAYWLDKFGGWRTDYVSVGSSSTSSNDLSTPDTSALHVGGIDLRARLRSADWDQSTSDRRTIASRWTGGGQGSWLWAMDGTNAYVRVARTGGGGSFDYQANCAISTLGLTDGQWADLRVTYDNTNRLRWYSGGTLVQTDTLSGMTTIESGTADLRIGNNRNAGGQSAAGFNGDISFFEMRDSSGTVLQTLNLDRMSSSGDTAWTPEVGGDWFKGGGFTATGSTIASTKRVRIDLEAPCPVNDFRLIVDAQTGALTVDEIVLEAACFGGVFVDGAVH